MPDPGNTVLRRASRAAGDAPDIGSGIRRRPGGGQSETVWHDKPHRLSNALPGRPEPPPRSVLYSNRYLAKRCRAASVSPAHAKAERDRLACRLTAARRPIFGFHAKGMGKPLGMRPAPRVRPFSGAVHERAARPGPFGRARIAAGSPNGREWPSGFALGMAAGNRPDVSVRPPCAWPIFDGPRPRTRLRVRFRRIPSCDGGAGTRCPRAPRRSRSADIRHRGRRRPGQTWRCGRR